MLLGTSGWSYQEWVGLFYPNNRVAKLPFYAKVFDTVEVDSSFYRMPTKSMVKGWEKATGLSFKFSLKLPKTITHDRRLAGGAEDDLAKFLDVIKPLEDAGKLGCLLVQLAPSFSYDEIGRLESFLGLLPSHIHFAVEFRHESWDRKEMWDLLKKHNVANTITESPIEFLSKIVVTSSTHAYIRWHGRGKPVWYEYTYSEEELLPWVDKLKEVEAQVPVTYAYFNNHYNAGAPRNALQFLAMRGELSEMQQKARTRIERKSRRKPSRITDFI
ncbi:DUF72 domain-containing protein [Nitrososphaera viennensis]|uniref:DUF72 domain-containing protein n=2 Tax=Nitrososphaera viennensis TaxID=1034015 RepID=A0A060HV76_9ARCH|nr:DUF72 domain-containing protein [Nitrososphaera viennensis]AIC16932.1 protein of unknown function DUF72 [Nitrososphaera viennensis EN76]UVS68836.1 DUF72 domain-containing protein [Nitrososphaera viennensis]